MGAAFEAAVYVVDSDVIENEDDRGEAPKGGDELVNKDAFPTAM